MKELHRRHAGLDGLVVLLDSCSSGVGGAGAAAHWVQELAGSLRFEVLTAAADRPAYGGCFTRALVDCLRQGLAHVPGEYLRSEHVRAVIEQRCPLQQSQLPTYNADEGLYLARNVTREAAPAWAETAAEAQLQRLTVAFQPTPVLETVVTLLQSARCVAVVGPAGVGKSALVAGLAQPEVTEGVVPVGFIHAIAFLAESMSVRDLAQLLAKQLGRSVPEFNKARKEYLATLTEHERRQLDSLQQDVLGPLRTLSEHGVVRLAIDGLEHLASASAAAVHAALDVLASDPTLNRVRLVVTSRPDTPRPATARELPVAVTADEHLAHYLTRRGVSPARHAAILAQARGYWIIARLLADQALSATETHAATTADSLGELYVTELRRVGAAVPERWRQELRPVLGVLAVAGVGPFLPLPLLCNAVGRLGGPARPARVRDVLVDLRGLVMRDRPGTAAEQVGLFHQTLADYLLSDAAGVFAVDSLEAHRAMVEALAELASFARHDPADPLHRYAVAREAEHLWALREYDQLLTCLTRRESVVPVENLNTWQSWARRLRDALGPDDPHSLRARGDLAYWTGEAGDPRAALRLYRELLADRERVRGPDDEATLTTRHNVAHWTGRTGDGRTALRLFGELLHDQQRVLGSDHSAILETCHEIIGLIGEAGDARAALEMLQNELAIWEKNLGPDDSLTLATRRIIALCTTRTGAVKAGLQLYRDLLDDLRRILGPDHPEVLDTQCDFAHNIGILGDAAGALRSLNQLLPRQQRILGPDHPDVLRTQHNIAGWTGACGDQRAAFGLFQALLPRRERVLGPDHPKTLITRANIADCADQLGDRPEARRLYEAVLRDQLRLLGSAHPDTLKTRANLAALIGRMGDAAQALQLFRAIASELEDTLGADHPDTLSGRGHVAGWTGEAGDGVEARRLFRALLREQRRVLGEDHASTLSTRAYIAYWTARAGMRGEARRLYTELLPDQIRVLGVNHACTEKTRDMIRRLRRRR